MDAQYEPMPLVKSSALSPPHSSVPLTTSTPLKESLLSKSLHTHASAAARSTLEEGQVKGHVTCNGRLPLDGESSVGTESGLLIG